MNWIRIDNRLLHGQVIEAWIPYTRAKVVLIVNDRLASDQLCQDIMQMAAPSGVGLLFSSIGNLERCALEIRQKNGDISIFYLFETCSDVRRACDNGFELSILNIANLHYAAGKKQLCSHISVSQEDISCLNYFKKKGTDLDFRCIPSKPVQVNEW
jgi:PTS system mannose-specific IIB component